MRSLLWMTLAVPLLAACERADTPEPAPAAASQIRPHEAGVDLDAQQADNIGIKRARAAVASFVPEAAGYAVIVGHDAIAQSVADVQTASAAARQSQAALARARGLANTPGAFSAETLDAAERQARADEAGLVLARRKLSATWGARSPWGEDEQSPVLGAVANGRLKLVRATFPLGALPDGLPDALQFSRFSDEGAAKHRVSDSVWEAPADATIPGRSLFALLKDGDVAEGERLEVRAPLGATLSGVLIPEAAVVLDDGRPWCYIEARTGSFERRSVDTSRPMQGGYFVEHGVTAGEVVVTAGAGLLLAREVNPGTEAD